MSKEEILHYFQDINYMYNDCSMKDTLSKCLDEYANEIRADAIEEFMQILTNGIDEGIRCAMCTNAMANEHGCDGGCVINQDMYDRVITVVDNHIEYAKNHVIEQN